MPDLEGLLARIGLDAAPPPTVEGLRVVRRAYVGAVPYEALAIQLGEVETLDVERIAARIVAGGRGGYCFELNGVLGWMLEQLGFSVSRHEGVVGDRAPATPPPTNHLALIVDLGAGGRWLADAGLGEGPVDPLPLPPARGDATGPLAFRISTEPGGGLWVGGHAWNSFAGVRIAAPPVAFSVFDPAHARLATDPDSSFVQTLVVQRPYADRIETLRARSLSVTGPAGTRRRTLADPAEFAAALDGLGVDPGVLGQARISLLWDRACAQHERWIEASARFQVR